MCLSIKVPIRNKSGNLFNDPRKFKFAYVNISGIVNKEIKSDSMTKSRKNKIIQIR